MFRCQYRLRAAGDAGLAQGCQLESFSSARGPWRWSARPTARRARCWCEAVAFAVVVEDAQELGLPVVATHDVQGHGGD